MINMVLPFPPSVNSYWRSVIVKGSKSSRPAVQVRISAKGRQYRKDVETSVKNQFGDDLERIEKPVSVAIDAHMPDKRKRDLDNLLKAIFDSLTHAGVWRDDSLVDFVSINRIRSGRGMVVMRIEEIENGISEVESKIMNVIKNYDKPAHSGEIALDSGVSCRGVVDLALSQLRHKGVVEFVGKNKSGLRLWRLTCQD